MIALIKKCMAVLEKKRSEYRRATEIQNEVASFEVKLEKFVEARLKKCERERDWA